jgi:hypothetical protein
MIKSTVVKSLPFFFIGKDTSVIRIDNYLMQKHPLLSSAIGKPDTKSIWYSKEHIQKLLEEIELAGGDGMRIYLGMYEATHEYAGQTCLLINSTREKIIGDLIYREDVILENEADYSQRSASTKDVFQPNNGLVKDFNYGSPCPPRCDVKQIP